jgi:hypothetical protein
MAPSTSNARMIPKPRVGDGRPAARPRALGRQGLLAGESETSAALRPCVCRHSGHHLAIVVGRQLGPTLRSVIKAPSWRAAKPRPGARPPAQAKAARQGERQRYPQRRPDKAVRVARRRLRAWRACQSQSRPNRTHGLAADSSYGSPLRPDRPTPRSAGRVPWQVAGARPRCPANRPRILATLPCRGAARCELFALIPDRNHARRIRALHSQVEPQIPAPTFTPRPIHHAL